MAGIINWAKNNPRLSARLASGAGNWNGRVPDCARANVGFEWRAG